MFSSNKPSTSLSCGFKVDTKSPGWHKSMMKILKKIKGGNFAIDVDEGVAYVSGKGNPNKLLKLMGSKTGKNAEVAFVKTKGHGHHDPRFYHSGDYYGQGLPYNYWHGDMTYPASYYPYSAPAPAHFSSAAPYYLHYPYYSGYNNYMGYYYGS